MTRYDQFLVMQSRAIRHYVGCGTKQQVLADHYGVQNPAISNIVTGKTWGWLV